MMRKACFSPKLHQSPRELFITVFYEILFCSEVSRFAEFSLLVKRFKCLKKIQRSLNFVSTGSQKQPCHFVSRLIIVFADKINRLKRRTFSTMCCLNARKSLVKLDNNKNSLKRDEISKSRLQDFLYEPQVSFYEAGGGDTHDKTE